MHNYTVQCLLTSNYFRSRFYAVFFAWLLFVLVVSVWSLLAWLTWLLASQQMVLFIQARLRVTGANWRLTSKRGQQQVRDFTLEYLSRDGVLALRLLYQNTKYVAVMEDVIHLLWEQYASRRHASLSWHDDNAYYSD